jgi:N-acetylmuramoyl-L-alanine amidase
MLENPSRLVIDVYAAKGASEIPRMENKAPAPMTLNNIRTIVIDPGHGGKDPGAIGPKGLKEKDIALSVGKKLGSILAKKHDMKVIYTRKSDRFVPLNKRTQLANSKKADLFISIHTNASKRRGARGIETYFLNWTNENQAMKVAARENGIPLWKMKKQQGGLQMILQDLARSTKKEESMKLAYNVQNTMVKSLQKNYRRVEDLGVKFALFYVLVGAEMPSILVEISFISNREEEKRLSSSRYRERIAEAIARGVNDYISQSTLIVQPAGQGASRG